MSSFNVVYMGSTLNEVEGNRGISHLMEHLLCKNLEFRQNEYDSDGIEFNAYTSHDKIVFYLTGLESRLEKYKDEFVSLIGNFDNITEDDFIKERNIVLSEYNDYFYESQNYLNFERKHFNSYGPIGSREDLEGLTFDDLKTYYKLQFSKPTYVINASSNPNYVNNNIKFSSFENNSKLEYFIDNEYVHESIAESSPIQKEIIISSEIIYSNEDIIYGKFFCRMLSYGLTSPLNAKIREELGLVYYINAHMNVVNNNGVMIIYTSTDVNNVQLLLDETHNVLQDISFLNENRFEIIKNNLMVRAEMDELSIHSHFNYFFDNTSLINSLDDIKLEGVINFYNKYVVGDKYKKVIEIL